jgi:hypothetical protein
MKKAGKCSQNQNIAFDAGLLHSTVFDHIGKYA